VNPLGTTVLQEQPTPASGRAHEFRTVDGKLEQLGQDGLWHPYVPFGQQRESVRAMKEAAVRGQERWREEARQRLEAKAAQRRTEQQSRAVEAQDQEVPLKQTQEMPAVAVEAEPEARGPGGRKGRNYRERGEEFMRDMAVRYRAAVDVEAFARAAGIPAPTLREWGRRYLGPAPMGPHRRPRRSPGGTESPPEAPPPRPPPPPPLPPVDGFDAELDLLRRLLVLPPDARDRIVAYLTARRGRVP
jgi:hypothetical protein